MNTVKALGARAGHAAGVQLPYKASVWSYFTKRDSGSKMLHRAALQRS